MLAPKVFSQKPTKSLNLTVDGHDAYNILRKQYFNHSVSLLLPDTLQPPNDPTGASLFTDTEYYHVSNLPAHELVQRQFINLFVKTGSVTLQCVDKRIDQDDSVAILPTGVLIFVLTADTFQQLGLEGKPSDAINGRYVIKIDLKSLDLSKESKMYGRLVKRLKSMRELTFNVILVWEPSDNTLCPSSIAAWFCHAGFVVNTCHNEYKRNIMYNLSLPNLEENELSDVLEWIGMVQLQCDLDPSQHALSSYEVPEPHISLGQLLSLQWTGMLTSTKIVQVAEYLQKWTNERGSSCWIAMVVNGFDDAVTSQGERESTYCLDGGYNITFFMQPEKSPKAHLHVTPARRAKNRKRRLT